ncbi:MAG: SixA phosphatase family protein [Roseicyclus sp.]
MVRTLILIRHTKSDWDDPKMDDHDRPLNGRGLLSAPRIGAWMAARGHVPDAVLCSTALRTRQTWAGIAAQLPGSPEPAYRRDLYLAEPETLLSAIRDSDAACLAVVAHNPGIGALASALAEAPPAHPKFGLYPTGATLVLAFDGAHLAEVAPGRGRVVDFAVPRELPDPA